MTEQEARQQVREAASKFLYSALNLGMSFKSTDRIEMMGELFDMLIENLTYPNGQPMLAILAENQRKLPRWQDYHLCIDIFSYDAGQQDMLKAGWRKGEHS